MAAMPDYDVQIDSDLLSKAITDVRDLAETMRTYLYNGVPTIAASVPSALHVVAAQLESEMRSWAHVESTNARLWAGQQGSESIRFPELRAVLTYLTPNLVSDDVRCTELRAAATRLRSVAAELAEALRTQSSPKFRALLEEQAAAVEKLADELR